MTPERPIEPLFDSHDPDVTTLGEGGQVPVVLGEDGRLHVDWPEGIATVPIDELGLRLLVDLANHGLRQVP